FEAKEGRSRFARTWDVRSGVELARIPQDEYSEALAVSPDGMYLATGQRRTPESGPSTAHIWEAQTGKELARVTHDWPQDRGQFFTSEIYTLCFAPDGGRLATAGEDGTVRVWTVPSGRELLRIKPQYSPSFSIYNRYGKIMEFSPDG